MRLIDDLRDDLGALRSDRKALKNFGLVVGGVLLLLSVAEWWRVRHGAVWIAAGSAGLLLAILGLALPSSLRRLHRWWMAAAFLLGWFVSRLVLILLFYGVLTPVAVAARLAGKKFLDLPFREDRKSYWVARGVRPTTSYDRMI